MQRSYSTLAILICKIPVLLKLSLMFNLFESPSNSSAEFLTAQPEARTGSQALAISEVDT